MGKGRKTFEARDFGISEFGLDVAETLKKYVSILLKSSLRVRSVVLLGSRAKGNWKPWSDTDVVVIAESFPEGYGKRLVAINPEETWGIGLEPRAYLPDDFIDAITALDLTALDAVHEGKIIFDDGFWERAKEAFEITKEAYKLRKIRNGWIAQEPL